MAYSVQNLPGGHPPHMRARVKVELHDPAPGGSSHCSLVWPWGYLHGWGYSWGRHPWGGWDAAVPSETSARSMSPSAYYAIPLQVLSSRKGFVTPKKQRFGSGIDWGQHFIMLKSTTPCQAHLLAHNILTNYRNMDKWLKHKWLNLLLNLNKMSK